MHVLVTNDGLLALWDIHVSIQNFVVKVLLKSSTFFFLFNVWELLVRYYTVVDNQENTGITPAQQEINNVVDNHACL